MDHELEGQAAVQIGADLVKKYYSHQLVTVGDASQVLLVPEGLTPHPVERFLAPLREAPRRRRGTVLLHDLPSFVAVCNRFKDSDSVVFADPAAPSDISSGTMPKPPSLLAVFNYNRGVSDGAEGAARWGDHRATYRFPLSKEWLAWKAQDGKSMAQADFAAFIEDRINDVVPPDAGLLNMETDMGGDSSTRSPGEQLAYLAKLLGGDFATPNRLVELSRGLAVREGVQVKGAVNLNSGESQLVYTTEHADQEGKPLQVPNLFLIALPVFEAGALYRLAVRLRYRIAGGRVNWFYQMYRPEKVMDHAFAEACALVADQTTLPVYRGTGDTDQEKPAAWPGDSNR